MITFLSDDIGLDSSSIELGINLSIKKYSTSNFIMELWFIEY